MKLLVNHMKNYKEFVNEEFTQQDLMDMIDNDRSDFNNLEKAIENALVEFKVEKLEPHYLECSLDDDNKVHELPFYFKINFNNVDDIVDYFNDIKKALEPYKVLKIYSNNALTKGYYIFDIDYKTLKNSEFGISVLNIAKYNL